MHPITIYTPTYNRAHLLPRVYESLCCQTCKEFIWLVIDDGSTDNTYELIQSWASEGKLEIQYFYKENGGVHTARDAAYHLVKTELITGVDSDDWMPSDAIENILNLWREHGGNDYAGIFTSIAFPQGKRSDSRFPDIKAASYQDFTYKYKYKGDKHTILRSEVIKEIPDYPVFDGERLVGEGYKWIQLPDNKPFLLLDKPTSIVDYQDNGYSRNAPHNYFKNPQGFRANHRQHIISSKYFLPRCKGHIGYIIFSLLLKDRYFIKNSPKPWVTVLLLPVGIAGYLYIVGRHQSTFSGGGF